MAVSVYKTRTQDRSLSAFQTKWDTYRKIDGVYGFYGSGVGTSRTPSTVNYRTSGWYTYGGPGSWKTFRAENGYLPTQHMWELSEFTQPSATVPVYFAYNGEYRVEMKTSDPPYLPRLSGISYSNPYFHSDPEWTTMVQDAQYKALSKARDMKVNVSVMLGEGRQTVSMLADTVRTLGKAYRNFRRGRFRQAAKELNLPFDLVTRRSKDAANHWLAYSYGWMPLLADAKGLLQLAEKGLLNPERGPRFSAAGKVTDQRRFSVTQMDQGASNLPFGETLISGDTWVVARAQLLLEYKAGATGLNSVGMGTFDPLLTAWELTPFSFVFDWFVDVGSYLEQLSTLEDVTVLTGFVSILQYSKGSAVMMKPQNTGWIDGQKPYTEFAWRLYKRYPWSGSVSLRTPLWDGLNARRLTTTAALWRQRTRGDRILGKYRP